MGLHIHSVEHHELVFSPHELSAPTAGHFRETNQKESEIVVVVVIKDGGYSPVHASDEDGQESKGRASKVEQELGIAQRASLAGRCRTISFVASQTDRKVDCKNYAGCHGGDLKGDTCHDEAVSYIEQIVAIRRCRSNTTACGLCDDRNDIATDELFI